MRLNLLDIIICPECGKPLTCFPSEIKKADSVFNHFCKIWCSAKFIHLGKNKKGKFATSNTIADQIKFKKNSEIDREDCRLCHRFDIMEGILLCPKCSKFFPIIESIPEVLPDELRNMQRDNDYLAKHKNNFDFNIHKLPISSSLHNTILSRNSESEWKHKKAEMKLTQRENLPEGFFGPGYVVPFEPLHPIRSIEKILRFMISVYHINLRHDDLVLDLGAGYAWTTEWLAKLGYKAIGVDINRKYLQIGMERTQNNLPPLVISDIEDLPIRKELFHGILFYDAFHHISNREKCLQTLSELLVPGGLLIMAEPGVHHETHPASIQVMETYGILEKGVTKRDLKNMIKNTSFETVKKFPYHYGDVEILLLKKRGKRIFDSKGPDFLNAHISTSREELEIKAGQPIPISLSVKNTGNTKWLKKTEDGIGEVRVGFQLKNQDRGLLDENFYRAPIPKDILSGEKFSLKANLPPIKSAGEYILEIDLVSEGIIWFKDLAYNPCLITLKVT